MRAPTHLITVVTTLSIACSPGGQTPDAPANVVVIVADALRQDVLGCYGGEALTPNIDWLAENGVVLENAYTNAPWTVPSSISMLTGNYLTSYKRSQQGNTIRVHVPDGETLFAEVLQQQGYVTFAKVDNIHAYIHNNLQGFSGLPKGQDYASAVDEASRTEITRITGQDLNYEPYWHLGVWLAGLLKMTADRPFFAFYWMVDPHEPYAPPPRFKDRIVADLSQLPRRPGWYEGMNLHIDKLSPKEQAYIRRLYIAEVESVDERVGFVIETLRQKNLLDNTYIVFTSDHGELFGERGVWGHKMYFIDGLMKVPLIIAGPGLPEGERRQALVSLIDLMPTMKSLLGVEYDDRMQGQSFHGKLVGDATEERSVYFLNVKKRPVTRTPHTDGLREGHFKLITLEEGGIELYDLESDPGETQNIAVQETDVADQLFEKIQNQRAENELRKVIRTAELGDSLIPMTDAETEETIKQLKALGYIK